jgi:hypothetical protein
MEIKLDFEQRHRANEMLERLAGADLEEFVFEFIATRDAYNKMRRLAEAATKAEREACAAIADARALRCEGEAQGYIGLDEYEVTNLRSLAWQFSVLADEMRKRSNA